MTKEQAAKLEQAYQWLAEGKDVECRWYTVGSLNNDWFDWIGVGVPAEFRIKPAPAPLLECWANLFDPGNGYIFRSREAAEYAAASDSSTNLNRIAVHLREVREPDVKAMVEWLMRQRSNFSGQSAIYDEIFSRPYAERIVRHILGLEGDTK